MPSRLPDQAPTDTPQQRPNSAPAPSLQSLRRTIHPAHHRSQRSRLPDERKVDRTSLPWPMQGQRTLDDVAPRRKMARYSLFPPAHCQTSALLRHFAHSRFPQLPRSASASTTPRTSSTSPNGNARAADRPRCGTRSSKSTSVLASATSKSSCRRRASCTKPFPASAPQGRTRHHGKCHGPTADALRSSRAAPRIAFHAFKLCADLPPRSPVHSSLSQQRSHANRRPHDAANCWPAERAPGIRSSRPQLAPIRRHPSLQIQPMRHRILPRLRSPRPSLQRLQQGTLTSLESLRLLQRPLPR